MGFEHPLKVGHQSDQSPVVHANCVDFVMLLTPVFVVGGSRPSVIQQMHHHADSSVHRNTSQASVKLQAQDCPDNVHL